MPVERVRCGRGTRPRVGHGKDDEHSAAADDHGPGTARARQGASAGGLYSHTERGVRAQERRRGEESEDEVAASLRRFDVDALEGQASRQTRQRLAWNRIRGAGHSAWIPSRSVTGNSSGDGGWHAAVGAVRPEQGHPRLDERSPRRLLRPLDRRPRPHLARPRTAHPGRVRRTP